MNEQEETKNANNKVDISYNFWLGSMCVVQTLPGVEDERELQQSIQEIRALLDEVDEQETKSC